jgi:Tol biopolymer transport system component
MKTLQATGIGILFLLGPLAVMAIGGPVTDPALVPRNSAAAIAFSTASWTPGQYSTTLSNEVWTVQPNGSALRQFLGSGANANYALFSPDGQWLYFQSAVGGRSIIYRSPINGSATYNVTPDASLGDCYGFNFAAHPAAGMPQMQFTSLVGGVGRVGVMNLDGSNARIVNPSLGYHYMGSLSPNGNEIVFSHTQEGYLLKRMNPDGTNIVSLAPSLPQSYVGQYTPDGKNIVFLNVNGDVYRVGRDGSNLKRLTTGDNYVTFYITSPTGAIPTNADEQHGSTDWPRISPNGQQIAYISDATGLPQVWEMNIDGTNQHQLTNLPRACGRVQWSPDGSELAFVSFDVAGHSQLFLKDLAGGSLQQLTHFTDRSVNFVTWSIVPEPGALTLLIAGGVMIVGWSVGRRVCRGRW